MRNPDSRFSLKHTPWLVLLLGLALTYAVQDVERRHARQALHGEFDSRVDEIVRYMDRRMRNYEQILRGGVGLFAASDSVDRRAFADYVAAQEVAARYPGIQGVGFSQWLPPGDVARHVARVRAEGFPGYAIRPPGRRDAYSAIVYLEPFDWRNRRAFGYDMYSEPVRRQAMASARDEDAARISARMTLVQETEHDVQPGFLMYLPVYRRHAPHATLEERRANLVGWVYAPFRMNDLINGMLGQWQQEVVSALDIEIYDGAPGDGAPPMFDSDRHGNGAPAFRKVQTLPLYGRAWTVVVSSRPVFDARLRSETANTMAMAGVAVSALLATVAWLLVTGRARALAHARAMTGELRQNEARQRRLNRALRLIGNCHKAIVHATGEEALLAEICRLIVEAGGYRMAWVGYAQDDAARTVRVMAHHGGTPAFLDALQITWADTERGRGPSGTAIRTGLPQVNMDFAHNPLLAPWRDAALRQGFRSSTALPLKDENGVFGVMTIYAAEPDAFNEAEMHLMTGLAEDLAFGIASLRHAKARRQAEEALRQLNQSLERRVREEVERNREKDLLLVQQSRLAMMGEMMRSVAHHWRQPLNALNLVLANIQDAYEYGDLTHESLAALVAKGNDLAQKMSATIDEFRNFFSAANTTTRFSLEEAMREAISLLDAAFRDESVEITLTTATDVFAQGVPSEMAHVLLNVLMNAKEAIRHRGVPGRIYIGLAREDGMGVIRIRDNGGGIAADVLPKIFDPYFSTKENGSGLGLYMARMVLEHMKGRVEARNVADGAEITLFVPAAE